MRGGGPVRADTVEKLRRAKIAAETWNIALITIHFRHIVCKSGLLWEENPAIRRLIVNRRVFDSISP
jgi:hypothetical protein